MSRAKEMLCPYDAHAHESFLIIRALDLQGMYQAARDGLARWLERDEQKPTNIDGQFADTIGAMSGVRRLASPCDIR